ncbi:MAG: FtsX-like permease family protein [Clostridia bacterium]|nr:FtsX-like permease family protein [Clostridia bacterium]
MALFKMILRKMAKNKLFILILAVGLMISAALLSAIPMYADGSLNRMLVKDLENMQQTGNVYPGTLLISYIPSDNKVSQAIIDKKPVGSIFKNDTILGLFAQRLDTFRKVDDYARNEVLPKTGIGAVANYALYKTNSRKLTGLTAPVPNSETCTLDSLTGLVQHIKLVSGRLPTKASNGVYEVLVTDSALAHLNVSLGETYVISDFQKNGFADIRVKPVGSFTVKSASDPYWSYFTPDSLMDGFILDEQEMKADFINRQPTQIYSARWYYAMDYHAINLYNASGYLSGVSQVQGDIAGISRDASTVTPASSVIVQNYFGQRTQLTTMMWSLNVPVIAVLCLYMFMISMLIIERERNEISLLSSRGAGRVQIAAGYLIEGLLLGAVAMVFGPLLGYLICRALGSSNEFLQFVNRQALPIRIIPLCFIYTLLAVTFFLAALIIPSIRAGGSTILEHKRVVGRRKETSWWEKLFIDIVLLAVALYGYYSFVQRQKILISTSAAASQFSIDPLLFLVPVIFIFGVSLLFLRVYPYLVKLIFWLGRRRWRSPVYLAVTQVGRSPRSYDFLMIFLVLTISIGIFSAISARTINENEQEKVYYSNGADIVLQPTWQVIPGSSESTVSATAGSSASPGTVIQQVTKDTYIEPDYSKFTSLAGVQHAAKVFLEDSISMSYKSSTASGISLMGLEPYDFGQVAWYQNGLLPHHINEYLNLLTSEPSACLISQSVSNAYGIKVGDSITVSWQANTQVVLNVYGIVGYWPSWNPNKDASDTSNSGSGQPKLIVANLGYIQNLIGVEPYQVWIKLKPAATSKAFYDSITKNGMGGIFFQEFLNSRQQVIEQKSSPFLMGINGSLTMGFLISGIICFLGFVLFWVISLRTRLLQFGVLRAMGLSSGQLRSMIIWEQLLTSGVAVVMGLLAGFLTSDIFVPFFQMSFNSASQVPPFHIVFEPGDIWKVLIFVGITLLTGIGVLIYMLSRIKMSNVIKLGED